MQTGRKQEEREEERGAWVKERTIGREREREAFRIYEQHVSSVHLSPIYCCGKHASSTVWERQPVDNV